MFLGFVVLLLPFAPTRLTEQSQSSAPPGPTRDGFESLEAAIEHVGFYIEQSSTQIKSLNHERPVGDGAPLIPLSAPVRVGVQGRSAIPSSSGHSAHA